MARRRRRTRHRRGAVATAMALAVFGIFVLPWLSARSNHDLTAASQDRAGPRPSAKLANVVELRCLPESIEVGGSVRPQADGMHLRVSNELGRATQVWVDSETGWSSGRFTVEPGTQDVVVSAPPGDLNIGCDAGKEDAVREVDLVDLDHVHGDNSLACEDDEVLIDPRVIAVPTTSHSLASAARKSLDLDDEALGADRLWYSDRIAPLNGYRETNFGTPMAEPAVRVVRSGETIAVVYFTGTVPDELVGIENPTMKPDWTEIHLIEHCPAFGERESDDDSSSTE